MNFGKGIKISLGGTGIETVGFVLDIIHHLDIGIRTPEGLFTPNHFIIIIGFLINLTGILITMKLAKKI